jgi:hypothetical protein
VVEIGSQITGLAKGQVHAFVEILTGLTITLDDFLSHQGFQKCPQLTLELPVVLGEFYARKVHQRRNPLAMPRRRLGAQARIISETGDATSLTTSPTLATTRTP